MISKLLIFCKNDIISRPKDGFQAIFYEKLIKNANKRVIKTIAETIL